MITLVRGRLGRPVSALAILVLLVGTVAVFSVGEASARNAHGAVAAKTATLKAASLAGTYNLYVSGSSDGQLAINGDGTWSWPNGWCDGGSWLLLGKTVALSDQDCGTSGPDGYPDGATWIVTVSGANLGSKAKQGQMNAPYSTSFKWYATKA